MGGLGVHSCRLGGSEIARSTAFRVRRSVPGATAEASPITSDSVKRRYGVPRVGGVLLPAGALPTRRLSVCLVERLRDHRHHARRVVPRHRGGGNGLAARLLPKTPVHSACQSEGSVAAVKANHPALRFTLPHHGAGPKHLRPTELQPRQRRLSPRFPRELLRGLIHSDGCRTINRFKTKLPSGRLAALVSRTVRA